jgi:hypothetical protein
MNLLEFAGLVLFVLLPGVVVTVVLFGLFYRNRNGEPWVRRRLLFPFLLMLAHTLLYPLAFLLGISQLFYLWFFLIPVLLIVMIVYQVHSVAWKNHDLQIAATALTVYPMSLLLFAVLEAVLLPLT